MTSELPAEAYAVKQRQLVDGLVGDAVFIKNVFVVVKVGGTGTQLYHMPFANMETLLDADVQTVIVG